MFCSPSNESSADCPPPKSPLKLARRNQPLSQSARIAQGGGLNDALGTKPKPKPGFAKGNRSFWMKYQIPQSSGTLLTQKHKMNPIIRARCAIWHRSQHALQLGNAEREPIVITWVANFQRELVLRFPASRHICILQGRENTTSNLRGKSKPGN